MKKGPAVKTTSKPKAKTKSAKAGKAKTGKEATKRKTSAGSASENTTSRSLQKPSKASKEHAAYRDYRVQPRVYNRWKPVTASTENFVKDVIDTNIEIILSKTGNNYQDVEDHLNTVRKTFLSVIQGMRVPRAAGANYRKLQSAMKILEETLQRNEDQIEKLDAEIELQERLQEQLEEEKVRLERAAENPGTPAPSVSDRLHPLLQSLQEDHFGLPPLQDVNKERETRQWEGLPEIGSTHTDLLSKVAALADVLHT